MVIPSVNRKWSLTIQSRESAPWSWSGLSIRASSCQNRTADTQALWSLDVMLGGISHIQINYWVNVTHHTYSWSGYKYTVSMCMKDSYFTCSLRTMTRVSSGKSVNLTLVYTTGTDILNTQPCQNTHTHWKTQNLFEEMFGYFDLDNDDDLYYLTCDTRYWYTAVKHH